jgi:regulator of replication initiation timing
MSEARAKQCRESKRRRRSETRGLTLPCDICGSVEGPELHCVASLPQKSFDLLCQVSGCQLSKSARVCCKHFTFHSKRPSMNNPLVVETEFATSFLMTPSTRKKPTLRKTPTQNVVEINTDEKHISIPQFSQIKELEREITILQKQNHYLQMKVEELEDENQDLRRERDAEHEMRIEREKKEKKRKEKDCLKIFGIDKKEISERKLKYWFGVENFEILFHEWEPFIVTTWNTLFLLQIFLVWLKHGFAMTFLSHILQKDKTTIRRNFFKTINDLQPWAKRQIT